MGLNVGNLPVTAVYVGSTPVKAVYVGSQKIWPSVVKITGTSGSESMVQFRQALADRGLDYSTITEVPFSLDTSGATSLRAMFYGCAALTTVPEMDTSSVTIMQSMFESCGALVTIPAMDTSNVTDMYCMFLSCSSLTSVPDLDTANVRDADYMFYGCSSLTDGNVRLIGKHASVVTNQMITGSGLTREPFFDAAGNPI